MAMHETRAGRATRSLKKHESEITLQETAHLRLWLLEHNNKLKTI